MAQPDEAKELYDSAIDSYRVGEYEEALEALVQARDLFVEAGDRAGEIEALGSMGVVYVELEEWDEAQRFFDQALAICLESQDRSNEAKILGNMGAMYERQGDAEKAAVAYEQAISIFRELDERVYEKDTARRLSNLKLRRGKFLDALGHYHEDLAGEKEPGGAQKIARRLFRLLGLTAGGGAPAEGDDEAEDDLLDLAPEPEEDEGQLP